MSDVENTAGRENGRKRPKGYADWRPQAKTRVLLEQINEVLVEYDDYLPLTCRQVFYILVGKFGYEKDEKASERLGEVLVRARRAKVIPFDAIRDDGIVIYSPEWYESIVDFWDETGRRAKGYRGNRQAGQDYRIELWCEATGMAPQLARVANDYSVPVFSLGGFSSLSAVRMIVDRARQQNTPTVLIHVGDFDPSGASIFEAMIADAQAFLREDRLLALQRLIPVRAALTADQVEQYGLATVDAKEGDRRSGSWEGGTCQLEALAPDTLADVVRAEILSWLDEDRLDRALACERDDRDQLLRQLPAGAQ